MSNFYKDGSHSFTSQTGKRIKKVSLPMRRDEGPVTADQGGRRGGALPWRPGGGAGVPAARVWTADRPESGGSSSGLPGTGEHGGL